MALEPLNAGGPQTATGRIFVGTSGWSYRRWRGSFYPERLAGNGTLAYYAARFDTVEIDRTFSSLPEAYTIERWRDTVPPGFTFAVKAPCEITHLKRLRRSEATLAAFLDRVRGLERALGPIVFTLPDGLPRDTGLLRNFLDKLPRDLSYAFEFRDESWFRDRIYDLLADHEIAFCIYRLGDRETPRVVTAPFVYLRLQGPARPPNGAFGGDEELQRWANACRSWAADEFDVRAYFDNGVGGAAVRDAATLRELVARHDAHDLSRNHEPDAEESSGRLVG